MTKTTPTPTPEQSVLEYLEKKTVKAPGPGRSVPPSSFYYDYRKWAKPIGIPTVSTKMFYRILERNGYRCSWTQFGKVYRDLSFINGSRS